MNARHSLSRSGYLTMTDEPARPRSFRPAGNPAFIGRDTGRATDIFLSMGRYFVRTPMDKKWVGRWIPIKRADRRGCERKREAGERTRARPPHSPVPGPRPYHPSVPPRPRQRITTADESVIMDPCQGSRGIEELVRVPRPGIRQLLVASTSIPAPAKQSNLAPSPV